MILMFNIFVFWNYLSFRVLSFSFIFLIKLLFKTLTFYIVSYILCVTCPISRHTSLVSFLSPLTFCLVVYNELILLHLFYYWLFFPVSESLDPLILSSILHISLWIFLSSFSILISSWNSLLLTFTRVKPSSTFGCLNSSTHLRFLLFRFL